MVLALPQAAAHDDQVVTFAQLGFIPSVVCAAVAGVVVSLVTPPSSVSEEGALRVLARERQAMEMQAEPPDPEITS
jgi:hypothetical protein